jgi:hypothetical protein
VLRESEREWMAVAAGHIEEAATAEAERDRLRDALRYIEWSNDSKWQSDCARAALKGDTP